MALEHNNNLFALLFFMLARSSFNSAKRKTERWRTERKQKRRVHKIVHCIFTTFHSILVCYSGWKVLITVQEVNNKQQEAARLQMVTQRQDLPSHVSDFFKHLGHFPPEQLLRSAFLQAQTPAANWTPPCEWGPLPRVKAAALSWRGRNWGRVTVLIGTNEHLDTVDQFTIKAGDIKGVETMPTIMHQQIHSNKQSNIALVTHSASKTFQPQ